MRFVDVTVTGILTIGQLLRALAHATRRLLGIYPPWIFVYLEVTRLRQEKKRRLRHASLAMAL